MQESSSKIWSHPTVRQSKYKGFCRDLYL